MTFLTYCVCVLKSIDNTPDPNCSLCGGEGYRPANFLERQAYWRQVARCTPK